MTTGEAWQETQARYSTAQAWSRSRFPITEEGEEIIAEIQREEEQAHIESRQRTARLLRFISQRVKPLEGKKIVALTRDEDDAA